MNRKSYLIALSLIGLCCSTAIAIQAAPKPPNSTITSTPSPSSQTAELTQMISIIEVQRALQLVQFKPETPQIENLNKEYTTLLAQLKQLEPARYEVLASSATEAALAREIGEVEVKKVLGQRRFKNNTPMIQTLDNQRESLMARLKQLQPDRYQALASSATQSALKDVIARMNEKLAEVSKN